MSSKYSQRLTRLSAKIFGEYIRPEMPAELHKDRVFSPEARQAFESFHYRNANVIRKLSALPMDVDVQRNHYFYPPHPQHKHLMTKLREFGLFRDEHLDFKEEMNRQRVLRGKSIWIPRKRGENDANEEQ